MINFFNNWFLNMAAWGYATDIEELDEQEQPEVLELELEEDEEIEDVDISEE